MGTISLSPSQVIHSINVGLSQIITNITTQVWKEFLQISTDESYYIQTQEFNCTLPVEKGESTGDKKDDSWHLILSTQTTSPHGKHAVQRVRWKHKLAMVPTRLCCDSAWSRWVDLKKCNFVQHWSKHKPTTSSDPPPKHSNLLQLEGHSPW